MYRRKYEPSANPILTKAEKDRNYALHKKKLSSVKPSIDTGRPYQPSHLKTRAKARQMMEEKYAKIEYENRLLLQKMADIRFKPSGVDNRKPKQRAPGSLNRAKKKEELERITAENLAILKRLEKAQPTYSHVTWEMEDKERRRRVKDITEFKQTPLLQRKARNRPASAMPSRPTAGAARAAADAADPHSRSRRPISAPVARSMQAQSRAPGPAYPVAHDYAAQQAYAEVMAGSTYPAEGGGSSTASESDHRPAKRTADGVKVDLAALEAQLNAFDFNWNDDRQEGQGRGGATGGGASPAKQSGNGTYYVPPPSSLDSYADDEFEDLEGTHLVSPSKERPPSPVVSPSKGSGSKAQSSHSPVGAAKPSPAPQKALSPKPREISPSGRPASRQAFNTTAGSAKSHSGPALATGLDEDTDSDIDF